MNVQRTKQTSKGRDECPKDKTNVQRTIVFFEKRRGKYYGSIAKRKPSFFIKSLDFLSKGGYIL